MKLLIITPVLPFPLTSGGAIAQFNFIESLRHVVDISLLLYISSDEQLESCNHIRALWRNVHVYAFDGRKPVVRKNFIQRLTNRLYKKVYKPDKVALPKYANSSLYEDSCENVDEEFVCWMNEIINREYPDIIQIEFFPFLDLIYSLPSFSQKVFVQHEIRYIRNTLELGNLLENKYVDYVYQRKKSREIAAMNAYDAVVTLTEIDRNKLINEGVSVPVYASPAAIKTSSRPSLEHTPSSKLIFLGGGGHPPNEDGLLWFLRDVLPIINKETAREICVEVIGKWSEQQKNRLVKYFPNIHFLGYVDDLESHLTSGVMIVPLRVGSGMRMKILEAAYYSVPFVTTSIGVEGLDFIDNKDCLIADSVEDFAKAVVKITEDYGLQNAVSINAAKTFDEKYSIDILKDKRYQIYNMLMMSYEKSSCYRSNV